MLSRLTKRSFFFPIHSAPEVLEGSRYSGKADVYGFAITMWEAITAEQPYGIDGKRAISLARKVIKGVRPPVPDTDCMGDPVHEKLTNLMTKCWDNDADKRPDFPKIAEVLYDISQDYEIEKEMVTQKNITEELLDLLKTGDFGDEVEGMEEEGAVAAVGGDDKDGSARPVERTSSAASFAADVTATAAWIPNASAPSPAAPAGRSSPAPNIPQQVQNGPSAPGQ